MNDHYAILLAGGKGTRMNSPETDKLLAPLHNTNAFRLSYEAFLGTEKINNAIIVSVSYTHLTLPTRVEV